MSKVENIAQIESANLDPNLIWFSPELRTRKEAPSKAAVTLRVRDIQEQGQLQPIGVCVLTDERRATIPDDDKNKDKYTHLGIFGEHRNEACKDLNQEVRCNIYDVEHDADIIMLQYMENDSRKELSIMDRLHAAQQLRDRNKLKYQEIGTLLRMSKGGVSELLSLEKLPDTAKKLLAEGKINKDQGLAMLDVSEKALANVLGNIKEGIKTYTAEQLREYAKQHPAEPVQGGTKRKKKVKKQGGRQRKIPAVLEAIDNAFKGGSKVVDVKIPLGEVLTVLRQYIENSVEGMNMTTLFDELAATWAKADDTPAKPRRSKAAA